MHNGRTFNVSELNFTTSYEKIASKVDKIFRLPQFSLQSYDKRKGTIYSQSKTVDRKKKYQSFKTSDIPNICRQVPLLNNDCLSELRWYYSVEKHKCFMFRSGSFCDSNGNNFLSRSSCESVCMRGDLYGLDMRVLNEQHCGLPAVNLHHCRPHHWPDTRYFQYGGSTRCRSIDTKSCAAQHTLISEKDCVLSCRQPDLIPQVYPPVSCSLPVVLGFRVCANGQPRWYYDSYQKRCRWFMYNGCHGNWNNFISEKACRSTCQTNTSSQVQGPERCSLPPDVGNSFQPRARFYFDKSSQQCRMMQYTGNGGNANNFFTPEECEAVCLQNEADKSPFLEGITS